MIAIIDGHDSNKLVNDLCVMDNGHVASGTSEMRKLAILHWAMWVITAVDLRLVGSMVNIGHPWRRI